MDHIHQDKPRYYRDQLGVIKKLFEEWTEFLGDPALATAILDRLSFRCDRIKISGKSYRLENRESFLNEGETANEI